VRLTPAELAAERTRHQRLFWEAFGFVTVLGVLLYAFVAAGASMVRHRQHGLLTRLDLGMHPADGIAVTAALLAVVVALNIALAAQQTPTDPRERVRAANWQVYVFLLSALTASATVTVTLICWMSGDRGDSAGDSVSLGLITLITAALASALQLKARSPEALIADEYVLEHRLAPLTDTLARFREQSTGPEMSRLGIIARCAYLAGLFGWVGACVALGIAGIEQRFLGWSNLIWMGFFGTALEACLLVAAMQLAKFRFLRRALDTIWPGYLLVVLVGIAALCTLPVLLPWPAWLRASIIGYYVAIWALAAGAFFINLWSTMRLAAASRASTERALVKARQDVLDELTDVRARKAAARRDHIRNRIRPSDAALSRRPRRPRKSRPDGRQNRPA